MSTASPKLLHVGDPAPWFTARCTSNATFHFDTVAGRHIVLAFLGSAAAEAPKRFLTRLLEQRSVFDDINAALFGVSCDPDDERHERLREDLPGIRHFWDFDREVSRKYGAVGTDAPVTYLPHALLLDPLLRVVGMFRIQPDHEGAAARLLEALAAITSSEAAQLQYAQAPVLVLPHVFEPALCRALIDQFRKQGGKESGFMRDVDGKTRLLLDAGHKTRRDCDLEDESLRAACRTRVHTRIAPEVRKAFQFEATRMERYIVACYDAQAQGHFRAHRDNTTQGTAHRRFAVTINLNAGEYEGGDLRFPEFGPRTYRPATGAALVFSCSLLHEVTPVTAGERFAFLPFLYDEAAAKVREETRHLLDLEPRRVDDI